MPDDMSGRPWRVVDQQFTTRVTAAGRFEEVVVVTVETVAGVSFPITLPVNAYSEETVRSLADAMSAQVLAVSGL